MPARRPRRVGNARKPPPLAVLQALTAGPDAQWPPEVARAVASVRARAARWLKDASVQGIGVGRRSVAGEETGEVVLKVYVDRKLPLAKLSSPAPKRLRIPSLDLDVPVDVEEVGRIVREHRVRRELPVMAGDAIGLADPRYGTGTLGCLVRRKGDASNVYLLSNAHVIAMDGLAPPGTPVLRPSAEHDGSEPGDIVAYLTDSVRVSYSAEGYYNVADAAIARLARPLDAVAAVHGIGMLKGIRHSLKLDMHVRIAGAMSGYSEGRIRGLNFFFAADYEMAPGVMGRAGFRDQVICTSYSRPGDSGAAVVDSAGRVIGLHVAGSMDGPSPCSVFSPIAPVLGALGIEIVTDPALLSAPSIASGPTPSWLRSALAALTLDHAFEGGVRWRLAREGLHVDGRLEHTAGPPATVGRIWDAHGQAIRRWASHFRIPVELVIATICTESSGDAQAFRHEPGYVSDEATPHRVSVGLMQTLISTARDALGNATIDRGWLEVPDHAIQAGTAYIDEQRAVTLLDPPKVACAYNAGGLYPQDGAGNRWRMRQYPIGSGQHADRFVAWFNDCFRLFRARGEAPSPSYFAALQE